MSRLHSTEDVPVNLFHAATIRDKEAAAKEHHLKMIEEGQINIFEVDQSKQEARTDMQEQAIKKLQDEMAAKQSNAYVQGVGAHLVQLVQSNETLAEKILTDGKTIEGSYKAMHKEAEKKKRGNVAMFMPQEGSDFIMKYFGIEMTFGIDMSSASSITVQQTYKQTETAPPAPVSSETAKHAESPSKPKKRFDVSLDEFL